jgi:hypothetical protein
MRGRGGEGDDNPRADTISYPQLKFDARKKTDLNFRSAKALRLSPATIDYRTASAWFKQAGGNLDGIIAKHLDRSMWNFHRF